jgi:hypothetical protein
MMDYLYLASRDDDEEQNRTGNGDGLENDKASETMKDCK